MQESTDKVDNKAEAAGVPYKTACTPAQPDVVATLARQIKLHIPERLVPAEPILHHTYASDCGDRRDAKRGLPVALCTLMTEDRRPAPVPSAAPPSLSVDSDWVADAESMFFA